MAEMIFGEDRLVDEKLINYADVDEYGRLLVKSSDDYGHIATDAGGRSRVSQLTTLFDGKLVNNHSNLIFEQAGTGSHTISKSNLMEVTAGQWCVYQTKRFMGYFSGKSQMVEFTFDSFNPEEAVEKQCGYFSSNAVSPYDEDYDGIYLSSEEGSISFNVSNAGTLTQSVDITAWTGYDRLEEYKTVSNWGNFTVCILDFLWLGGAVARLWVKTSKGFILAHQFDYSGTAKGTFINSPMQPVRFQIRSSTGSGSFKYICSQAATEGSFEEDGISMSVNSGYQPIQVSTAGTVYPIIGVRKNAAFRDVSVRVNDFSLFVNTVNDRILYTMQINPTLSSPLSYSSLANSEVQYALGNGSITVSTPGTVVASGFVTSNTILPSDKMERSFLSYLGGTLDSTMDEMVLCVTPLDGITNVDVHAEMNIKEY